MRNILLVALVIALLAPQSALAATSASEVEARIAELMAKLATLQTNTTVSSALRVEFDTVWAGASYARVYGLPSYVRAGIPTRKYVATPVFVPKDGSKSYMVNGHFTDEESIPDGGEFLFFPIPANPNLNLYAIPSGTYQLQIKISEAVPINSYSSTYKEVMVAKSGWFTWPQSSTLPAPMVLINDVGAPSCTLTVEPSSAVLGDKVKVTWVSENAKKIRWVKDTSGKDNLKVPSGSVKLNGSRTFKMTILGNPTLTMKVTGKDKTTATCSVTIPVTEEEDIFTALEDARARGVDAKIQSLIRSLAVNAEIYYDYNYNSYGPVTGKSCTTGIFASTNPNVKQIVQELTSSTSTDDPICYASPSAWATQHMLTTTDTRFCMDSTGMVSTSSTKLTSTSCP